MSKRKYKKGALVTSIDDLFKENFYIVCYGNHPKTQHAGWLTSMQARCLHDYIQNKMLYFAEPIETTQAEHLQER